MSAEAVAAQATRIVDCDVHCPVPTLDALAPYLDEQWVDYLDWTNFRTLEPTVDASYPRWSPMLATTPATASYDLVREQVLGTATTAILTCYAGVEAIAHPYVAGALATAVNRWMQTEWLDRDERLLASAAVTPQHTAVALEEIERIVADGRFVQLLLPARTTVPYGDQRYWPIWEAAAEHGLVLAIAYGGTSGAPPTPLNWTSSFFENYVLATQTFRTHLTSLLASGVFERWPTLKVAVVESGWAWVPGFLWRMDFEWKANLQEVPWMQKRPSEYVAEHVRFTAQPADLPPDRAQLEHLIERFPPDELLLFSSDFPHRYGGELDELLDLLPPDRRERVLWRNASDLYRLDDRA